MMSLAEAEMHRLTFGLHAPFNRVYRGISHCYGCDKMSLFPDLSFCHGSYHQSRSSRCSERYIVSANGEEATVTRGETMRHAKALHSELVESKIVQNITDTHI
jgi:hypothetical protein